MEQHPITIVTGAGSGIGRAIAIKLGSNGHRLALVSRTASSLNATREVILASNPDTQVEVIPADIGMPDTAQEIVSNVIDRWQRLDVLVNAAGMAPSLQVDEHDFDLIRRTIDVNAVGPAALVIEAWPHWIAQGAGCLVNISSLSSIDPFPGFLAYGMSKSAMDGLVRSVHNEGSEHGIRAFTLTLGAVETKMLRSFIDEETLPTSATLDPDEVASRVMDCIDGQRDQECGTQIQVVRN